MATLDSEETRRQLTTKLRMRGGCWASDHIVFTLRDTDGTLLGENPGFPTVRDTIYGDYVLVRRMARQLRLGSLG